MGIENGLLSGRDAIREGRLLVGRILFGNSHRQISREIALPIGRLVTVLLHVPRVDPHLIEIVREAILIGCEYGNIFRHFIAGHVRIRIGDLAKNVRADNFLAFRQPGNRVRHILVERARPYPTHAAGTVAYQPVVLKIWRWWRPGLVCPVRRLRNGQGDGLRCVRPGHRGPHQQLQLVILWQQVKAVGRSAGSVAEPVIVTQDRGRHYGIVGIVFFELVEFVVDLLVDHAVVLDPAHFPSVGFDLQKAAAMLDDLEPLAVDDLGDAIADRSHAVAQVRAPSPDIDVFVRPVRGESATSAEQYCPNQGQPGQHPQKGAARKGRGIQHCERIKARLLMARVNERIHPIG